MGIGGAGAGAHERYAQNGAPSHGNRQNGAPSHGNRQNGAPSHGNRRGIPERLSAGNQHSGAPPRRCRSWGAWAPDG
jgi:hypothetical protein